MPGLKLWMYLLPGFGLAVVFAYFVPELFVGMAFDAGGVASGPMTATFSLAFVQGIAAQVPSADLVADGFGMIAIVAMMPIIALELLGALYQVRTRKAAKTKSLKREQLEVTMDNQNHVPNVGALQVLTLILSENQSHRCVRLVEERGSRRHSHHGKRHGEQHRSAVFGIRIKGKISCNSC